MDLNYISMNWLLVVRIWARALHIVCVCVTMYWVSQLILSFQALILMLGTVPRTIAMTAWDTDQILRSSLLSASTRFRGIYFCLCFWRDERLWYSFYDTQILRYFDTHLFWAPACVYATFENSWYCLSFIYDDLLMWAAFGKSLSEIFLKVIFRCITSDLKN